MNRKVFLLFSIVFLLLLSELSFSQSRQWRFSFLDSIPSIKFLYPEGVLSGSYAEGVEGVEITIQDCGIYVGQICICTAAGFRIAKLGIDALFLDNEIPTRSDFYLITSKDHMVSDVVKYIFGLNRRVNPERAQYFVDQSIKTEHRHWHYYLVRKDNLQAYRIIYNKGNLIPNEENEKLKHIEENFDEGDVTSEEAEYFGKIMSSLVESILKGKKDYLFKLEPIDYSEIKKMFPNLLLPNK